MDFDWGEYLKLAKYLAAHTDQLPVNQETAFRNAVSRAYYAAFCHARNYAVQKQWYDQPKYPTGGEHADVRTCFSKQGKPEIAEKLDRMHKWRNECDYQNNPISNPPLLAQRAIGTADVVFATLKLP